MSSQQSPMDQETAKHLFREGGMLVFLDVPPGTEFGIDYNSWKVGSKFKGVKMIPPGIHFIYYSAVGKDGQSAPRTGFFHNFQKGEVVIKKWHKFNEDISDEAVSVEEQERVEGNREELDRYLGAYPYDSYKKWISLTNHLAPALLDGLAPLNGKICSVAQFASESSTTASRAAAPVKTYTETQQANLPDMPIVPGTEIRFTHINKQTYPKDATPEQVTKYSMDHSYVLETLLDDSYKNQPLGVLGELQFAFICFLVGQVFEGFEQWKKLVRLLCMSDESLVKHPELFRQFISVMHYQVTEIPEDFFVDIVSNNNFLVTVLHAFFSNLESSDTETSLKDRGQRFLSHLQKKFKWDFSLDADEDCPVVVE